MQVMCPYCDCDVDVDNSNLIDLSSDNYIEDYECDNCGREFDIYIEFEPIGSTEKIIYTKCDCCGEEYKIRNLYKRGNTFPFPKDKKYSVLCNNCHAKLMFKQWEQEKE